MYTLSLHESNIVVGETLANLAAYLPAGAQVVVVSNSTIYRHYQPWLKNYPAIMIGDGERFKTLAAIDHIAEQLLVLDADRNTFLLGFGGGIVCDVAGFAASIFMRGCNFGFVPTTLLSQVDASVGGKNGVNFQRYKNMLGVFNQPRFVLCTPEVFATLEQREFTAGFAEIVKAAMITNPALFEYLETNAVAALARDAATLQHVIYQSLKIKADIVAQDEREHGVRRKLNLGHTFAHAIEKSGALSHGQAVSIGLCMASRLAQELGLMTPTETARVNRLLAALQLPTHTDLRLPTLLQNMVHDKKKSGNGLHLILPVGIGDCQVRQVSFAELESLTKNW